jgi:hypothetical protein
MAISSPFLKARFEPLEGACRESKGLFQRVGLDQGNTLGPAYTPDDR